MTVAGRSVAGGIAVAGDAQGGWLALSAGTYLAPPAGGALNLYAFSANGRGGDVFVSALGNDGAGNSITLNNIDVSGVRGGTLEVVELVPLPGAAGSPVAAGATTIANVNGQATGPFGQGASVASRRWAILSPATSI